MTEDQKKILAQLAIKGNSAFVGVSKDVINSSWQFDDFESALASLLKEELITNQGGLYRITKKGRAALKGA